MGIQVGDNFDHKSKKPLDARTSYSTLALMKAVTDANIYEGCEAYCAETDKYYKFKSTNTVDETTGKWRERESGGGGVIQGYAYARAEIELANILTALNTKLVTRSVEVDLTGHTGYDNPTSFVAMVDNAFATLFLANVPITVSTGTNDGFYSWKGAKLREGTSATSLLSAQTLVSNNVFSVSTFNDFELTNAERRISPGSSSGTITTYIAGDVTASADGNPWESKPNYPLVTLNAEPLVHMRFYLDSSYTQEVTPNTTTLYEDIPTGDMYVWNGTEYVKMGGNVDTTLSGLTDTNISSPSDGQLLGYDETSNKWGNVNAPSTDDCYKTGDNAETGIVDDDYFPFYDTSATAKRKSLWSNIKSVLKTYFDTLYSTVKSKGTPTSGGTDLSLVTTGDLYAWNNKANAPTVLSQTLSAGSTSVTFSNVPTTGNYLIYIYTSKIGLDYDTISQSGSTVTLTYPSQSSDVTVYMKIEEV